MTNKKGRPRRTAHATSKKKTRSQGGPERRADEGSFEAQLRAAISAVDVADSLTAPLARSIENLLRLAAHAVGSGEASVLVRDGTRGGLKFMAAIGEVADKLLKVKLPPGKGIAGFVFASGQPVAVADVRQEEAFYPEVDRATGYLTQTVLATPLQVGGETVGVLEFVNRLGERPYKPFSPEEMDRAAHFADAIATLVDAQERAGLIGKLFERASKGARSGSPRSRKAGRSDDLQQWLKEVRSAPEHRDLISLAISLRDIASRGEAERRLCREILDALARWADTRGRGASSAKYFD
jgi:GAF domain-containing protein